MADVFCLNDTLTVHLTGRDRNLAAQARLEIPLDEIRGVDIGRSLARNVPAGASQPFFRDGNRVYWDVRNPRKAIVIELADDTYSRLVIDVSNPVATIAEIRRAIRDREHAPAA